MSRVRLRILVLSLALILGLLVSSVPQTMAQGNSYMVQSGDTLFNIAMRYNTTPELLMAFNGLFSPTIYVGQVLTVPSTPDEAPPAPPAAPPAPAASSGTVVVQEGDTLFSLATHHGMTVASLKALNGLTTDHIYIGQVLKLSGNAAPPAPAPDPQPLPAASRTYIVQPNDTLYSIAVHHGSSVFALKKINGLVDDYIYVGQVLNLSGNTPPPAPAPTPAPVMPAPTAAPVSGNYAVQPGDTLFRIALGHHTTVAALKALNGLTSDHIYAGQILKISAHVAASQPPSPPHAPPPPKHEEHYEPKHGETYIVQVGDTLSLIATRYKTTVGALMKANRLTSDTILIGQSLVIPGRGGHRPPPPHKSGTYYTVQGGDTLSHIAAKYGVSLGALAQVNHLRSNNWIYIGQRLLIPKGEHAPAPPPAVVPPTVPDKDYYHIVRPSETLSQIAWQYKTSVHAIVKANHLRDANQIFIGQRLYISGYHHPSAKPHPKPVPVATHPPATHPPATHPQATHPPATATTGYRATSTPVPPTYPPATATMARVVSSATPIPPTYPPASATTAPVVPRASATTAPVAPPATPYVPPATSTAVRVAPTATPAVDTASEPPYVPPASDQPPVVEPEPTAAQSAAPQGVWGVQVFTDECGTEDTRHFTSAVRVNVEGVEDQEVDLFVYPIQESNFITWGKTGSKPVLGPFGVEFAPLGAGNYAVSVPGVGESPSFYLDGDCIAHINFGLGGP